MWFAGEPLTPTRDIRKSPEAVVDYACMEVGIALHNSVTVEPFNYTHTVLYRTTDWYSYSTVYYWKLTKL